jgi:hypothetical protein
MSDYVPTESESDREASDNHHSPALRPNQRIPRQTQAQSSQTGPIRTSSQPRGHNSIRSIPPLGGRELRRPTAASPQTARPPRAGASEATRNQVPGG